MPLNNYDSPPLLDDTEGLREYMLKLHDDVYGLGSDVTGTLNVSDNLADTIVDSEMDITITGEWTFETHPLGLLHDLIGNLDWASSGHTLTDYIAGTGLNGGGTIATDRTFNLDLSDLTSDTPVATDTIAFYDVDGLDTDKVTIGDFVTVIEPEIDHSDIDELEWSVAGHTINDNSLFEIGTAGTGAVFSSDGSTLELDLSTGTIDFNIKTTGEANALKVVDSTGDVSMGGNLDVAEGVILNSSAGTDDVWVYGNVFQNFFQFDTSANKVVIQDSGGSTAKSTLEIFQDTSVTSGAIKGIFCTVEGLPSGPSSASFFGLDASCKQLGPQDYTGAGIAGTYISAVGGSGDKTLAVGVRTKISKDGTGNLTTGISLEVTSPDDNNGTFDNNYGIYVNSQNANLTTDINAGLWLERSINATANYGIVLDGDGLGSDISWGDGQDAKMYYDGTDLIIDSALVGTGAVKTTAGRIINTTRLTSGDSPYTVLVTDHIIICDTDGGAIEIDLTAGVEGKEYRVSNVGSSGNDVTVDPNGTEQIFSGGAGVAFVMTDTEGITINYNAIEGWW